MWALGDFSGIARLGAKPGTKLAEVSATRFLMGTVVNLTLVGEDRSVAHAAVEATLDRMAALEAILSRHRVDSQLSQLNATGSLTHADQSLLDLLDLSFRISRQSDGAFDVTIKPLVDIYQRYHQMEKLPPTAAIEQALTLVDYTDIQIDGSRVSLAQPGMAITLDGIGKGYIVDAGVETLASLGFANVLVEAGGDLSAMGEDEGRSPWKIGVQPPRSGPANLLAKFDLSNQAAATSGDYMQSFTTDLRHHHILDPRTGYSARELASATVIAPTAALADGLATALMVSGVDVGRRLIEKMGDCGAYLVTKEGSEIDLTDAGPSA